MTLKLVIVSIEPAPHAPIPQYWGSPAVVAEVLRTLREMGYEANHVTLRTPGEVDRLAAAGIAVFPNARYFPGARRQYLSTMLEARNIPYFGSSEIGHSAESKGHAKKALQSVGIPTPDFIEVSSLDEVPIVADLRFPLVLKPDRGTESLGVTKVSAPSGLSTELERLARQFGMPIIVEEWCRKREFTVAVIGAGHTRRAFPVEITVRQADYLTASAKARGTPDDCRRVEDGALNLELRELAVATCEALGTQDWARVEILQDVDHNLFVIDVNTLPGLRPGPENASYLPICMSLNRGLSYEETIAAVVGTPLSRLGLAMSARTRTVLEVLRGKDKPP